MTDVQESSDADLIEAFLGAINGLGHTEAERASNVSEGSIRRWRKGDRRDLNPGTRDAIVRYIEGGDATEEGGLGGPVVNGAPDPDARLDEIMRTESGYGRSSALIDFALAQRSIALRDLARAQRVEAESSARRQSEIERARAAGGAASRAVDEASGADSAGVDAGG